MAVVPEILDFESDVLTVLEIETAVCRDVDCGEAVFTRVVEAETTIDRTVTMSVAMVRREFDVEVER